MKLNFSKYHGCGNDFICTDLRNANYADIVPLAIQLCRRGYSIGADGFIVVMDSSVADYKMLIINADGTIPEMCGNGLRCFVSFLIHQGITGKKKLNIETDAGIIPATIISDKGPLMMVNVDLGTAAYGLTLPKHDFNFDLSNTADYAINVADQMLQFVPVSVGNPHAVFFVPDVDAVDLDVLGPLIEHHSFFPNRVNVEFIDVQSPTLIKMRVWERGVGETNACGTGACASVVAAVMTKHCDQNVVVDLKGGRLEISFDSESLSIQMLGPSEFVFSSQINV